MNKHASPNALLTRFAPSSGAASWNKKDRTFRAVIAAGAGVARYDYDGPYKEYLDPAGVEPAERIPVLNTHRSHDIRDVVGTVVSVERVGDRIEATLRMSRRPEVETLVGDIADGVVSGVSIGYSIQKWTEEEGDDGARTKTATKWLLHEVSIVPIPADPDAHIRGKQMTTTTTSAPRPAATAATGDDDIVTRAAAKRVATIRTLGEEFNARDFAAEHERAGTSVADFRNALIDHLAEKANQNPTRTMTGAAAYAGSMTTARPGDAMGEAIFARIDPTHAPSPDARQFMGLTLPEMARESLRMAGADERGLGPSQVIQRALERSGGMHTTSDFSVALSSAVGRVLRKSYDAAPSGLRPLARRMTMSDFRVRTAVSMSGFSALEKVNEHGEFKRGTISDAGESIKLETFGKVFAITRQALVNDDIGAFADLPRKLGLAAAAFEAEQLAALLIANPLMADGKAVFHVDHGNLGLADEPNATSLSAARIAMRAQTDASGQLLRIAPRHLVVGPELETSAEKLMATIAAPTTLDTQPIKLAIVVEPRITGRGWYVVADPAVVDGLTYAHLDSEPGPQLEQRIGFDVDGMEFKVRLDFGCAFLDHRGWFKNQGA